LVIYPFLYFLKFNPFSATKKSAVIIHPVSDRRDDLREEIAPSSIPNDAAITDYDAFFSISTALYNL
jgi:hypothetical protein